MTHKELVKIGKEYLISAKRCNPVFCEKGSANISEIPDIIGFKANETIVIECKTSVSDFRNDKKKGCRINGKGLGTQRYYLITYELFDNLPAEILAGWGIITINIYGAGRIRKSSKEFISDIKQERDFLRSRILEIQRYGK